MNLEHAILILEILSFLQGASFVKNSHVQDAKLRIGTEIKDALRKEYVLDEIRVRNHRNRWRSRKRLEVYLSSWTAWSKCDESCRKRRERYCKVKRKCGHTKHVEETKCWRCPRPSYRPVEFHLKNNSSPSHPIFNIQQVQLPVLKETNNNNNFLSPDDFFILKTPIHGSMEFKKQRKFILFNVEDYKEEKKEDFVKSKRRNHPQSKDRRNLRSNAEAGEYDEFNSDDETYESTDDDYESDYDDDYEEYEQRNATRFPVKEKAVVDLIPRHKRVYSKWSKWTKCSPKCTTRRYKKCRIRDQCGREVLREIAYCYTEGSFCQQWLHAQLYKTQSFEIRPSTSRKKDSSGTPNAIVSDFIISGKGYRGPEYTPMKLKCGIAPIKSLKRNIYSMLKIIGGKAAKKGEWPWQAAIFNRFKEAFCGGTLIAPQWVLTAAHCVRKVLYVRLGDHHLDYDDGTELQFRVAKSIKHPNFDKKTVDSDIALLRLPRPVNSSTWIGFSCLPRPFQSLPRNLDCTVIGWGKRRNRDQAGTSVLHQAEVPIIPMEYCRSVYYDYTITKNMFCAGHKRGRIDTCAGDSGGPLLCRDSTKPNHPWTIFGITSFGDGCAKRNKFGIYTKVPNYVDWIWSVVNCNGNCKPQSTKRY